MVLVTFVWFDIFVLDVLMVDSSFKIDGFDNGVMITHGGSII